MNWAGVMAHQLDMVWHLVQPLLERSLAEGDGEFSLDDMYQMLVERRAQLYVLGNGSEVNTILISMIEVYPQFSALLVWAFAGVDIEAAKEHEQVLVRFAQERGIKKIRWLGRKGFERVMKPLGYEAKYVVMSKDVSAEVLN